MVDQALHEHAASLPTAGHANRSRRLINVRKNLYATIACRSTKRSSSGNRTWRSKNKTRRGFPRRVLQIDHRDEKFFVLGRPGSDLLFQALRLSTIGAEEFNGRVRYGNGFRPLARTTRSAKDGCASWFSFSVSSIRPRLNPLGIKTVKWALEMRANQDRSSY